MKFGFLLIMLAFASDNQENKVESENSEEKLKQNEDLILVKIEEDEYTKANKKTSSTYIGVSYKESTARWLAQRWRKNDKKMICYGTYRDEETAAHASDTLARKLLANGEQNHTLNFPDDDTEVFPEEKKPSSKYIGVSYDKRVKRWSAQRWSKKGNKMVHNGNYKDEETAAHASDSLARKLIVSGEQKLRLNFPDDDTKVFPGTKMSKYIGVYYNKSKKHWSVQRRSRKLNKTVANGIYKDEETAAHASDTLAIKLMSNGEQNHKLNFPDDNTEHQRNKRKRSERENVDHSQNK